MGYKDITPGIKLASLKGARFISSKDGTMGIECEFEFEEKEGNFERINWQGWLSPKAIEYTMKTLHDVLGFNGDETHDQNGMLTNPEAFNYRQQVSLEIEMNTYKEKTYPKVKYVNKLGGSAYGAMKTEVISTKLSQLGFKAAFLAAKQKAGATTPPPAPVLNEGEVIPF